MLVFPNRLYKPLKCLICLNCWQNLSLSAHYEEQTQGRADNLMDTHNEYRYNRLTWAEMNDAIAAQKVVLLPVASTEQHGRHLPLDVDVFLCESVCLEAGRRAPESILSCSISMD